MISVLVLLNSGMNKCHSSNQQARLHYDWSVTNEQWRRQLLNGEFMQKKDLFSRALLEQFNSTVEMIILT